MSENWKVRKVKQSLSIDFESDYIRAIDFSNKLGLFSISDNGFARLYDINKEIVTQILNLKKPQGAVTVHSLWI